LTDFQLNKDYFLITLYSKIYILAKCSAKNVDYRRKTKFLGTLCCGVLVLWFRSVVVFNFAKQKTPQHQHTTTPQHKKKTDSPVCLSQKYIKP